MKLYLFCFYSAMHSRQWSDISNYYIGIHSLEEVHEGVVGANERDRKRQLISLREQEADGKSSE